MGRVLLIVVLLAGCAATPDPPPEPPEPPPNAWAWWGDDSAGLEIGAALRGAHEATGAYERAHAVPGVDWDEYFAMRLAWHRVERAFVAWKVARRM